MDVMLSEVSDKPHRENDNYKSTKVEKHLEVDHDVGALLVSDPNELNSKQLKGNKDDYILNLTRDNVQLLIYKVWELPTERFEESIVVKLPPRRTDLPRTKPVPEPKQLTKWLEFSRAKGIVKKKKRKLSWDEQLQKWVPLYGYRKAMALKEKEWVLEVPDNANPMEDQFAKRAEARSERKAKNELQRLRNIAKAKNIKVPRVGVVNPEASTAKDLQTAVTVAKSSTASLGKFQPKLPHEKEARGVSAITPGASRKRKLAPAPPEQERTENLNIIESVLNKRPKIDINKAVSRHINKEKSQEKKKPKAGKKGRWKKDVSGRKKGASGWKRR